MRQAPVTIFLVVVNTGIFILMWIFSNFDPSGVTSFFHTMALVPVQFWDGAIWQPFTSMFIHGPIWHIGFNMIALWSLGTPIEKTVGSLRYSLLYLFSGLCSALFIVVFQSDLAIETVGASGAILGLLGALGVFFPNSMMMVFFFPMRARTAVFLIGLASLIFAFFDNWSMISHWGHLGGLVGGLVYSKFALKLALFKNTLKAENQSRPEDLEEQLRRIMNDLPNQRSTPEPFNTIIRDEPEPNAKRVFFDPVTGRYYLK
ncbi:MAG: rhomboid family intramembrane serine protease [Leptonema sp. (in: Bacteria)]|nr:rhomboid family intramembrane serine protease [Leptonema sp. (in: bacteria)]